MRRMASDALAELVRMSQRLDITRLRLSARLAGTPWDPRGA
jgi:hypothetical protein